MLFDFAVPLVSNVELYGLMALYGASVIMLWID
jgi:hypothetical protein